MTAIILVPALQAEGPSQKRFLELVRVLASRAAAPEVVVSEPDGETRTLTKGDVLAEEGGARLEEVTDGTLVFRRATDGAGETVIVVRYDASGETRVREFRSVPSELPEAPARDGSSQR